MISHMADPNSPYFAVSNVQSRHLCLLYGQNKGIHTQIDAKEATMKEFMIVFRLDLTREAEYRSPEQMQTLWKAWQDWTGNIAAQNKLGSTGKRLGTTGKVARPSGPITDGPFVEVKEALVGYMFVKAESLDEAMALMKDCPNLAMGGSIEVRPVLSDGKAG